VTYGELREKSTRLATALAGRGVSHGDRVPVLMTKRVELVVVLLALWRLGAVHVPLFTAFAKGAIELRVEGSRAELVITETTQLHKLDGIEVATLDVVEQFDALLADSEPLEQSVAVGGDGVFVQLYTSGTTGKPKGVPVSGRALAAFRSYMHFGLDVREDDVFWNAADPGWAYGLYYGIIGPLASGRPNILFTGGFTAESTAAVLRDRKVTNFAGAPTIYRALSQSAEALPTLRQASSAGEPLTPDVIEWSRDVLGVEVRDHYGQTELGMAIANGWHDAVIAMVKPGSMGRALPGFTAGVHDGQIALDVRRSPLLWFTGYLDSPEKTAERFTADGDWYLTADTGRIDDEGYLFFSARDDDVILAAGYRIGPFEVESVLSTHPNVADVAVVGRPDPDGIRGEIVEAFVVLTPGAQASDALATELRELVRNDYSKHAAPRRIHFRADLPKTPSGKIQRYLLRNPVTPDQLPTSKKELNVNRAGFLTAPVLATSPAEEWIIENNRWLRTRRE
ncbi:AMP-binding protein, partial [Rhodococcus qingshengii]|uniref:AMP-binding protein n=1 Tax=Rhodococcus qingshengii TaxID=334542 RepID=UPI001BEB7B90